MSDIEKLEVNLNYDKEKGVTGNIIMTLPDIKDEWNSLDTAAKANLTEEQLGRFMIYKRELKRDGHLWIDDAEDVLSGYIWEYIDEEPAE